MSSISASGLSPRTVAAIAALGSSGVKLTDAYSAFEAAGIKPVRRSSSIEQEGIAYVGGPGTEIRETLKLLNLSDPDEIARVLRFTSRIAELYESTSQADKSKLVRLRNCLTDDGFSLEPAGDVIAAISALAAASGQALVEASGIRAELTRLEQALPDDPGMMVGRAKNLIEATAKAVLHLQGKPVNQNDGVPKLVHSATTSLGVHPSNAQQEQQITRILGNLNSITQNIAELRNTQGDGHGASTASKLTATQGRLAARAAIAWCAFMLDTAMDQATTH